MHRQLQINLFYQPVSTTETAQHHLKLKAHCHQCQPHSITSLTNESSCKRYNLTNESSCKRPHLLSNKAGAPVGRLPLKGLSKEGVEGLRHAVEGPLVGCHSKRSHVQQAVYGGLTRVAFVQQVPATRKASLVRLPGTGNSSFTSDWSKKALKRNLALRRQTSHLALTTLRRPCADPLRSQQTVRERVEILQTLRSRSSFPKSPLHPIKRVLWKSFSRYLPAGPSKQQGRNYTCDTC